MTDTQQIIDEIEEAKQKLIDATNKLKENEIVVDDLEEEDDDLDTQKREQLVDELDNSLNDALLNLIVKKD
jgi:predicted ATP-grasp superfamily ATP-dependent carboligase